MKYRYSLIEKIQVHQFDDVGLRVIRDKVLSSETKKAFIDQDGILGIGS